VVGAGGAQDAVKKDMALLEGDWSMVSGEIDAQAMPEEFVKTTTRVAKGDETIVMIGGKVFMKAAYTIVRSLAARLARLRQRAQAGGLGQVACVRQVFPADANA
jgi:hypothetical protein